MGLKVFPLKQIYTDGSSGSGNIIKADFSCGYVGELEYNKEELKLIEFLDDTKTNSDEEETDVNFSRQENLHWCKCLYCTVMPTFIKCKCCEKFKDLLDDKLSAGYVTNYEDFDMLTLNKSALEMALIKPLSLYIKIFCRSERNNTKVSDFLLYYH